MPLTRPILLFAFTALTACSQADRSSDASAPEASSDVAEAPNIALTAAPGVSFNYAYQFLLPDDRISAAQEAHAAACEKLGPGRCRITGMRYSVSEDGEGVSASLSLKLDPAIARAFGKESLESVERNDGRLHNLEISGIDELPQIQGGNNERQTLTAQLDRLRKELANPQLKGDQRASLQQQITALEQQLADAKQTVAAAEERLATTPMAFNYYGRGGAPGFHGNPLRAAWHLFLGTVVLMAGFALRALAVLIPVGLVLAALIYLWRSAVLRRVRRWFWPQETTIDG